MAGHRKNRSSTSWWPIINRTILQQYSGRDTDNRRYTSPLPFLSFPSQKYTVRQKKRKKLADRKTRQRATRGI